MAKRPPVVLFLEPFILLAVGLAAAVFAIAALSRRAAKRTGMKGGKSALAVQCCAIPCLAVAVVMPSIGPAAMLSFFAISLVAIMRMQRDE